MNVPSGTNQDLESTWQWPASKRNFKTVDKTQICDNLEKSINQVMLNLEPIFQENFDNHFTIFIQTLKDN